MNDLAHDWKTRWTSMVTAIRIVRSTSEERALLSELAGHDGSLMLGFVNAHAMNSIVANPDFFDALQGADILLRDGAGMAILYRRHAGEPGLNMNGTDFIPKILAAFRGRRVALWGTREPCLRAAAARCEASFGVRVVSLEHGFHEPAHYLRAAAAAKPDLIVLGMGMPKQEQVARALRADPDLKNLIVCGGAILDFLGGRVSRAPRWVRRLGIEWAYRLLCEPRRLFSRYVVGNPLFLIRTRSWGKHVA